MWRRGSQATGQKCGGGDLLRALLDPTRLLIVAVLTEGCRRFIELQRILGISKGRLYFHIRVLEDSCIVERHYRLSPTDKPALYLCLNKKARKELIDVLDRLVEQLEKLRTRLESEETQSQQQ